jgi:hypothetical protein
MTIGKKFLLATFGSLAIAVTSASFAAQQYRLLLSGPVESVDRATNTVTILGHRLTLGGTVGIVPGHRLNVFGVVRANGSLGAAVVQDTQRYAASGDRIQLVGAVTRVDRASGVMLVGNAAIDYTQMLGNPRFKIPRVGDLVHVIGTQPAGRGLILAGLLTKFQGVNAGGQAVGVNAGGQAVGVNAGGQAVGVNAGGQAVGVNAGGQAVGVNAGGQAVGVNAGGQAVGVNAGGQAVGVNAGGQAV